MTLFNHHHGTIPAPIVTLFKPPSWLRALTSLTALIYVPQVDEGEESEESEDMDVMDIEVAHSLTALHHDTIQAPIMALFKPPS